MNGIHITKDYKGHGQVSLSRTSSHDMSTTMGCTDITQVQCAGIEDFIFVQASGRVLYAHVQILA